MNVYLAPGRLFASAEAVQVTTILGSCVSVCLWDSQARAGGINHYLLPDGVPPSPRFSSSATNLLVASVLEKGARRETLRARVVGGACVNKGMLSVDQVTQRNAAAAEELASTAEELATQAASQRDLVAFFKVDGTLAEEAPATSAPLPLAPVAAERVAQAPRPNNGSGAERANDADFRPF